MTKAEFSKTFGFRPPPAEGGLYRLWRIKDNQINDT